MFDVCAVEVWKKATLCQKHSRRFNLDVQIFNKMQKRTRWCRRKAWLNGEVFRSRVGYEVGGNLLGIACLARDFGFTDRQ